MMIGSVAYIWQFYQLQDLICAQYCTIIRDKLEIAETCCNFLVLRLQGQREMTKKLSQGIGTIEAANPLVLSYLDSGSLGLLLKLTLE